MARRKELYANHIPKQCWDVVQRKWRPCDEIATEGFGGGKKNPCCLESYCCLTCEDLNYFAQWFTQINTLSEAYFFAGTPSIPPPAANDLITAFNSIQTKWNFTEGIGFRNIEEGYLCDTYLSTRVETSAASSPLLYQLIFESDKPGCPDLRIVVYIQEIPAPAAPDHWFTDIGEATICIGEDAVYDQATNTVHCTKCIDNIPARCEADRDVIVNLPSPAIWGNSYEYRVELFVGECCENTFASFYIPPNPYVSITPSIQFFPISPGVNIISVTIDISPGSGTVSGTAFVFIRAGCAEVTIPLKYFIDDLP